MKCSTPIILALVGALVTASACQTPEPMPDATYVEVPPAPPAPDPEPRVVAVPYAQPIPGQAKPWPEARPTDEAIADAKAGEKKTNKQILDEANEKARQHPTPDGFFNAVLVYDFMPGALYQIWGAPNHLTTMSFAPGEEIVSTLGGDTKRWKVLKTYSVENGKQRQHLVIEPRRRDLHTTFVITTTLGVYLIEARSYQHAYLAGVEFNHPYGALEFIPPSQLGLSGPQSVGQGLAKKESEGAGIEVNLDQIVDDYHLIVDDKRHPPHWAPRRVFHDGKRTFIDFGYELGDKELPALFVLGPDKSSRLVQYKSQGRYMVVGQVIHHAMLRLGDKPGKGDSVGIELDKEARR